MKTVFSELFLLVDLQVVELVIIRRTAVHELKGLWYQEMQIVIVTRTGSKDKVPQRSLTLCWTASITCSLVYF